MINIVKRVGRIFIKDVPSHFYIAAIVLFGIIVIAGCNKENNIGLEIQPPDDKINVYIDSLTNFSAYTIGENSLTTSNHSYFMMGSYIDPVFGRSKAEFVSQILLSTAHLRFGDNPVADSLILYLDYGILTGNNIQFYYGDTTTSQEIKIYELEKDIYHDSTYYSDHNMEDYFTAGNEIGTLTFNPKPSMDSLAIHLSADLANRILQADTVNLDDNDGFLSFFKGIYLATDFVASDGSILYFDILSSKTRMTLYYSNSAQNSLSYDFDINDKCGRFSLFEHDYTGTVVEASINDTINQTDEVYIQSMAGTKAFLKFELDEELLTKAESGISINKAELIFQVANDPDIEKFKRPDNLFLTALNQAGLEQFLDDYYLSIEHFDGKYYPSEGVYKFNIARYLRALLDPDYSRRKDNYGLYLFNSFNRVISDRLILEGGKTEANIKLKIVYSVL